MHCIPSAARHGWQHFPNCQLGFESILCSDKECRYYSTMHSCQARDPVDAKTRRLPELGGPPFVALGSHVCLSVQLRRGTL